MKKLSYLFAVAASAACLCACTDVTDALPAEQIPADARSTLGADVVLQWNNEEQTINGFGVARRPAGPTIFMPTASVRRLWM